MRRIKVLITGQVDKVGFRAFIYHLAKDKNLSGWVKKSEYGIEVQAQGEGKNIEDFLDTIKKENPELAKIQGMAVADINLKNNARGFKIAETSYAHDNTSLADRAICEDCIKEMHDPKSRYYNYAFTNCKNCGPYFTIKHNFSDENNTLSIKSYEMCKDCLAEYKDSDSRRFQADNIYCKNCGPKLYLQKNGESSYIIDEEKIWQEVNLALDKGDIIAIKGLGGYHLACDAHNQAAILKLRQRKKRPDKPFAVMFADIETLAQYAYINDIEQSMLLSQESPIVLLNKKNSKLAQGIAPDQKRIGAFLPYTPLHYLLFREHKALVMTSANISGEPIVFKEGDQEKLWQHADYILSHNRKIIRSCDDSVAILAGDEERLWRRSRGFVPKSIPILYDGDNILACGAEQKNTFCLTKNDDAYMSQHIGELINPSVYKIYNKEIKNFQESLNIEPELIVNDMHPDYMSTHYAKDYAKKHNLPRLEVQHHHAHMAACLGENAWHKKAIGIIFDGSGFGPEGNIWGGEVLVGDCANYERVGHFTNVDMPGGERAIWEPWRMAMSYLSASCAPEEWQKLDFWQQDLPGKNTLWEYMQNGFPSIKTSSMGRMFDAVAVIIGHKPQITYEGQAAIWLEQIINKDIDLHDNYDYAFDLLPSQGWHIDWQPIFRGILADLQNKAELSAIATRFHNTIVDVILRICLNIKDVSDINTVALAGGVFQNVYLLENSKQILEKNDFRVLINKEVPINDAGISFGQATVALAKAEKREKE